MATLNDNELKQTFAEGQNKLIDYQRQLATVRTQVSLKDREARTIELSLKELGSISSDNAAKAAEPVNVYKSVGKMFLQSSVPELEQEMTNRVSELKSESEALSKKQEWLERQYNDTHSNLKEILNKRND